MAASSLSADEISKDNRQKMDADLVNIINLAQAYSGQVRTDIIANAQEIQRLLGSGDNQKPVATPQIYQNSEVEAIVSRIKAAWPYSGQKIIIQNLPEKPLFTVLQVKMIINAIDFDKDKKEVLSQLLPGVVDPENVDSLFDIFWTPYDKQFLNSLVKKRNR